LCLNPGTTIELLKSSEEMNRPETLSGNCNSITVNKGRKSAMEKIMYQAAVTTIAASLFLVNVSFAAEIVEKSESKTD